jgi:hypothetical protein
LTEECRLRVFENGMLRRIFGPGWDEVTCECRRLHNEELYAIYSSPNVIQVVELKKTEMGRTHSTDGERRGAYRALVGKPEGGNHLEDPGIDWSIILKWIFERFGGGIYWIDLSHFVDRWRARMNAVMDLRVP